MAHERVLTVKGADGTRYSVDEWESAEYTSLAPEYKFPARIKNLDESFQLDRWETADQETIAPGTVAPLKVAIEGFERLVVAYYVEPEVVTITRHAPFLADALADAVDVDTEFVDSENRTIRR